MRLLPATVAAFAFSALAVLLSPGLAAAAEPASPLKVPAHAVYTHFFDRVKPLLAEKCVSCHGAAKQEGGLRLDNSDVLKGGDSGPALVPGNPDKSLLIQAIRHTHDSLAMPPQDALRAEQVAALVDWVKLGAVWVDPAMVLVEDEETTFASLGETAAAAPRMTTEEHFSGRAAMAVAADRNKTERIGGWRLPIVEKPAAGEYRYLRFTWKKTGGGGAMLEVGNSGRWPDAKAAAGRYAAGIRATEIAATAIAAEAPADWTTVTVDLWKDLGNFTLSGLTFVASGGRAALFDAVLVGPTVASLDAYSPGRGRLAVPAQAVARRHGDAWTDPENPIAKLWNGARLDLWSLKAPKHQTPPAVRQTAWVKTPVDNFVLARLEQRGLAPSAEADRRTLIRRVSFDLVGLPPTPEDAEEFLGDARPDAYEQLVDRLLASPRYGEHAARRWLDVVRYADTNGFERDEFRPMAYRYRDYVIRAFNADKPYDQFITEQLAGDEILAASLPQPAGKSEAASAQAPLDGKAADALIATGYMRLGPFDTAGSIFDEVAKSRDQLMADLVSTTGSAFLGLTMSCCRCHDHKYDPFSQADNYRMQAFFAGVKFHEVKVDQTAPQQAIVDAHATSLAAKRKRLADLELLGRMRVAEKRRAALPADVRALLARDESSLTAEERAKVNTERAKLKANQADSRAALSDDERTERNTIAGDLPLYEQLIPHLDRALCMVDSGDTAPPTRVLSQGDYQKPLDEVPPGFLSILDPNPADVPPVGPNTTGRRTRLARWIASPENPLTARVVVNRLWQQHFGLGIVGTANDFGYSGLRPTHPDLLDYLASQLVTRGWSLKALHRAIVLSATYRQASADDPARHKLDPDNLLLWRQSPRRLEAEALRDAMLTVSGRLLPVDSGPPRWPQLPESVLRSNPKTAESPMEGWSREPDENSYVRTVFTVQKRSLMQPLLESFDLPDPTVSCARRNVTTVAPQALMLLNSPFAVTMSESLAERAEREAQAQPIKSVDRIFRLALARSPDDEERELAVDLLLRHTAAHAERIKQADAKNAKEPKKVESIARRAALADLARAVLNTSEFIYID